MEHIASLRAAILAHYDKHKRDLPWRRTKDPYAIWVSEIMLQQTQVDVVAPRWASFLTRYPDVRALAAATEAAVCEAWAGLGYYRRARMLHRAAQVVVAEHDAAFPRTAAELQELPGIGRYTSGAIASIAFGEEAPIVDGNVARLLSRIFAIEEPVDGSVGQRRIWELATQLVAGERPGDLNQGLMEMGATVCTPKSPKCLTCPVRPRCEAARRGEQDLFPKSERKTKVTAMPMAFAVYSDESGTYLAQRPLDGLWAGLWEPPSASGPRMHRVLSELVGGLGEPVAEVTHQLSHRAITAQVYRVATLPAAARKALKAWPDPFAAPLSGLARKVLTAALTRGSDVGDVGVKSARIGSKKAHRRRRISR